MIDADSVQVSPIPGELRFIPARPALGKGGTLMLEVVWNGSSWLLTDFAEGKWFTLLMMRDPFKPRLNSIIAAVAAAGRAPVPVGAE